LKQHDWRRRRGFAVVADEIGKLAFQTKESIKEMRRCSLKIQRIQLMGFLLYKKRLYDERDDKPHARELSQNPDTTGINFIEQNT
jgi:hypothetical protein